MAFSYDLLPPIVQNVLPAFAEEKARIYFTIGTTSDIKTIQYSISNQNGNTLTTFGLTQNFLQSNQQEKKYGDHYFLIDTKSFQLETYYKIQLRVSRNKYQVLSSINPDDFSEWSSVCLIKKIQKPQIIIEEMGKENSTVIKSIGVNLYTIKGQAKFPKNSTEKLKNYSIKLYQLNDNLIQQNQKISESGGQLVLQTDILSPTDSSNYSFEYLLPIILLQGVSYKMIFKYTTSSGYSGQSFFLFESISLNNIGNNFQINLKPDPELGEMKVTISSKDDAYKMENIVIRRTSSETKYLIWDDIKILQYNPKAESAYSVTWRDKTIKSGVFYKYGVCILKENGARGAFKSSDSSEQCIFDDMYLNGDNKSLRIRFNPSINNFKYNVNESIQQTLGSQFPFAKRNGYNFYRTFSIGGLITSYMDTHSRATVPASLVGDSLKQNDYIKRGQEKTKSIFDEGFYPGPLVSEIKNLTSKDKLYDGEASKQALYNQNNDVQQYEDIIYQREFRQAVYQFLYKNNVKLFRSTQQGNILVKLTEISFSPLEQLGRQLYSFTATATEIDKYSIRNCDKYNIQNIGQYEKIQNIETYPGQIERRFTPSTTKNISNNLLSSVYSHFTTNWKYLTMNDINDLGEIDPDKDVFDVSVNKIYNLQIEIDSPPAPVSLNNKGELEYMMIEDNQEISHNYRNTPLGYIVIINNKRVFVKAALEKRLVPEANGTVQKYTYVGRYDLPSDVKVTSLKVVGGTLLGNGDVLCGPPYVNILINYMAQVEVKKANLSITNLLHFQNPGQLWGTFEVGQKLRPEILKKISFSYNNKQLVDKTNNIIKSNNIRVLTTYKRHLDYIWWVNFQGPENAIIWIKTSGIQNNIITTATNFSRHILANGYLNLNGMTLKNLNAVSYTSSKHIEKELDQYINNNFITPELIQEWKKDPQREYSEDSDYREWLTQQVKKDTIQQHLWHPQWIPQTENEQLINRKIYIPEFFIYDFYFCGVHLTEKVIPNHTGTVYFSDLEENNLSLRKTEFVYYDQDSVFESYNNITDPKENVVYTIKNIVLPENPTLIPLQEDENSVAASTLTQKWIYYNGSWCKFIDVPTEKDGLQFLAGDVLCPVDAIVNYYYAGSYEKYQLI